MNRERNRIDNCVPPQTLVDQGLYDLLNHFDKFLVARFDAVQLGAIFEVSILVRVTNAREFLAGAPGPKSRPALLVETVSADARPELSLPINSYLYSTYWPGVAI